MALGTENISREDIRQGSTISEQFEASILTIHNADTADNNESNSSHPSCVCQRRQPRLRKYLGKFATKKVQDANCARIKDALYRLGQLNASFQFKRFEMEIFFASQLRRV